MSALVITLKFSSKITKVEGWKQTVMMADSTSNSLSFGVYPLGSATIETDSKYNLPKEQYVPL